MSKKEFCYEVYNPFRTLHSTPEKRGFNPTKTVQPKPSSTPQPKQK